MKRINYLSLVTMTFMALASILFTSCDLFSHVEITEEGVHANQSLLDFKSADEIKTVVVNASVNWNYTVSQNWAKVSRSGNILTVSVETNNNPEARSCELIVSSTNKNVSDVVKITQETSLVTVSSDVPELNFSSYDGAFQSLYLKSNGDWQVSSTPEWLRPSVSKGNGNKSISFTALTENKSANPRRGTVIISTNDQELNISVCQYGGAALDCIVRPNHVTTLSNGIAFDLDYSQASNVAHYYRGYLEASHAGIMTNDEIISTLKSEFQRHLPSDDEVVDFAGLKADTKYIIYTLAYNMDGKHGELTAVEVKTNSIGVNEPCGWVGDITYSNYYWYWTVTKSATCYSYYMMSTEDQYVATASDVLQAWWLEDAVRRNQVVEYLNGGDWQMERGANVVAVWTRGVSSTGTLSGKIDWNGISVSSSTRAERDTSIEKNREGDHSGKKLKDDEYKLYLM